MLEYVINDPNSALNEVHAEAVGILERIDNLLPKAFDREGDAGLSRAEYAQLEIAYGGESGETSKLTVNVPNPLTTVNPLLDLESSLKARKHADANTEERLSRLALTSFAPLSPLNKGSGGTWLDNVGRMVEGQELPGIPDLIREYQKFKPDFTLGEPALGELANTVARDTRYLLRTAHEALNLTTHDFEGDPGTHVIEMYAELCLPLFKDGPTSAEAQVALLDPAIGGRVLALYPDILALGILVNNG